MRASVVTSRPVVGSSRTRRAGSQASAIAIDDALLLAARELVRVAAGDLLRVRELDGGEQLEHPGPGRGPAEPLVLDEDLDELVADGQHRVERARRVLEHHRQPPAPQAAQLAGGPAHQVLAAEAHLAGDLGLGAEGRHDRERDRALPGAGLADEPEDPARRHDERHSLHRPDRAGAGPVRHPQVANASRTGSACVTAFPLAGSERQPLAEGVAQQVRPHDGARDCRRRQDGEPRRLGQERQRLVDHEPPVRRRRLGTEPQEAERGGEQDRVGEADRHLDDDRRPRVRQHLGEDDVEPALAAGSGGVDELGGGQAERDAPHHARRARHEDDRRSRGRRRPGWRRRWSAAAWRAAAPAAPSARPRSA